MYTRFNIVDKSTNEILAVVYNWAEAQQVVEMEKLNDPYREIEVVEIEESAVKPGFGRDPDLH